MSSKIARNEELIKANYEMAHKVVDALKDIRGIESVGMSDGFNDETTFSITLDLEAAKTAPARRNSPFSAPSEFVLPLQKIKGLVKQALSRLSAQLETEGWSGILRPVADKVSVPRPKYYNDEFGDMVKVFPISYAQFHVYMDWNWTKVASTKIAKELLAVAKLLTAERLPSRMDEVGWVHVDVNCDENEELAKQVERKAKQMGAEASVDMNAYMGDPYYTVATRWTGKALKNVKAFENYAKRVVEDDIDVDTGWLDIPSAQHAGLIASELVTADEMMQYCPDCARAIAAGEMTMTHAELQEQLHGYKASLEERVAAKWESMPKGWTDESREKFWNSLTGDVKHKVTKCMKEMEGKVSDTGAFCASLADRVDPGWRSRSSGEKTAADLYFDSTPDWDKIRFMEPKHWVFTWKTGGWNSVIARSKKEAIVKAKKEWKGTKWDGQWDESSFKVPTRQEYRMLMID